MQSRDENLFEVALGHGFPFIPSQKVSFYGVFVETDATKHRKFTRYLFDIATRRSINLHRFGISEQMVR